MRLYFAGAIGKIRRTETLFIKPFAYTPCSFGAIGMEGNQSVRLDEFGGRFVYYMR